ncbi:MAG TPA: DUF503 domain-containing protein [Tepidisphaeraceae bacterium]|nr:DUF503 domain-containing protein [Tepidisphaeraceae bacterium]
MTIGILQIEIEVPDAMSLKDKRRQVLSLKDRIRRGHNVSVAEVGGLDEHRRAVLGVAMVSNDLRYVQGALDKIVELVKAVPTVAVDDWQIDFL